MIIGLTGYAQHGKDTVGQILVEEFGYKRFAFADQLKSMALVLNPFIDSDYTLRLYQLVQDQGWESAKQNPEVRRFLQVLGTEAVRDHLGDDAWVLALEKKIESEGLLDKGNVVITDVRFPNEAAWLTSVGGVLWRVTRLVLVDDPESQDTHILPFDNGLGTDHPSEQFIKDLPASREITAADLHELREEVCAGVTEVRYGG